jgi:hypothetical protein
MPIDFPSNPVAGQTYPVQEYGTSLDLWRYNGVAWDKVKLAEDSWALWGVSGQQYLGELQTGILYGGVLSINAGNSATFDYTEGAGFIANPGASLTALPEPTGQRVTWAGATGVTLAYLTTADTTWLRIDSSGSLIQSPSAFTNGEYQTSIVIGALVHPSRTFINLARTFPITSYGSGEQYEIFIRSFGPLKLSGHVIEPSVTSLRLNRTSGRAFALGRNYPNDPNYASVVVDGNYIDSTIFRYYRGATAGTFITVPNQTTVDPTQYDDGSGTLQAVAGGLYTIQRIFYFPGQTNILGIYYGRQIYNSLDNARANLFFEEFSEIENTLYQAIFCAYLIVKSNATDLNNITDAQFIQAGLFRNTSSGGGGLSVTALDDLSDVVISTPTNDEVLTYESTQWVNRSISSIGVSRVNGLTGAINLAAGSNITITPSGLTLTISSSGGGGITTYVESFNGLTGAVTGVTTGVANTFIPLQTFNGGLSASGATISGSIILQNSEYIRNTTNGRIDLMPAPAGSTHFGIYFDNTSWGFGTVLGTIRSSDGAINTGGNFRFDVPLTVNAATRFQLGSDGHYGLYRTDTGLNTGQMYALSNNVNNSGAIALVSYAAVGNANRSPTTSHVHPNFYIYANGTTSANDYIRFEHGVTYGLIASGGTSGVRFEPGSGAVEIVGGISASGGITLSGPLNLLNTLLINSTQGSSNQVLTSTGSGITWATPSGSAGISRSITTITSSTSAGSSANTDYVYNGNTTGAITLTLPTAVSNTNRYTVKNSNIGILSIYTTPSETIDGATFYNLTTQYQAVDLLSDNTNWFIV